MRIIDRITCEQVDIPDKNKAFKMAKLRVTQHTSNYTYGRFGRHTGLDVTMVINKDTITICTKEDGEKLWKEITNK